MLEKVKETLQNYVDFPAEQIGEDTAFIRDMNMNSFDVITMLGELEETYGISFEQDALSEILTVGDLVKYLEQHVQQ